MLPNSTHPHLLKLALFTLLVVIIANLTHAQVIWIEAEDAAMTDFNQTRWYARDKVLKYHLSPFNQNGQPGDWLAHFSDKPGQAKARYIFDAPQTGDYVFWLRANPGAPHVPCNYYYKLDDDDFKYVKADDQRGWLNLSHPKFDLRFLAWYRAAEFNLTAGRHTLEIKIESKNNQTHGGLDVIAIADPSWHPTGALKPDQLQIPAKPDSWFIFSPTDDTFSEKSIIDMSHLIEKPAGKHGFLKRVEDQLQFDDGTPVKFWGINAHMTPAENLREQQARFYAKYGVNLVREHPVQSILGLLKRDPDTGERYFDPENLDKFDKWFATLKNQGIYMCWSLYYPLIIGPDEGYPSELYAELPDKRPGKSTSGLVNFMPQLQQAQFQGVKAILNHVNPYTNLAYKDDPALAILEVHNEDSIFWHAPLGDLAKGEKYPRHTAILKKMWGQWVKDHYHNDARLRRAWGKGFRRNDSVDNPAMGIYGAWEMAADGPRMNKLEKQRMGDFIRFLAELQRGYYDQREKLLREIGYKAVTVTTAWRAGGPAADPANLYCDDAMDMIDRHNYFGGGVGRHHIEEGEVYNKTHLASPGSGILASGLYQVEDKPFAISEWTMCAPSQYKAEIAPLFAFYGMGLQGWDASTHFASWSPRLMPGWPNMRSYAGETPHYFGQFPALAFAIYNNHIQQGDIVAARRLSLDSIFQGVDALSQDFTAGGYDNKELTGSLATPAETLAVGRVTTKIADKLQPSVNTDLTPYWNQQTRTITSNTGQLTWNYDQKVVLVTAEKTHAIICFADSYHYNLPALTATINTPFVSLIFTALDDKPLTESKHILVTALAQDKQMNAHYNDDGSKLIHAGIYPLLLQPVQATVALSGPPIQSIHPVDIYGVPTDTEIPHADNQFTIDGRYQTYYYEINR